MNSGFVIQQAKALAARTIDEQTEDRQTVNAAQLQGNAKARIQRVYRLALARDPDAEEVLAAQLFVDPTSIEAFRLAQQRNIDPGDSLDPWVQLAQVLLLCNEFAFVD